MYRLTARMVQAFRKNLEKYHELFSGGRCSGWELEELIFKSIQSDNVAQHHAFWREGGHDDLADIQVVAGRRKYNLQIKSGSIKANNLVLSGYRLGRFDGSLSQISGYLNGVESEILSVPCERIDDDEGRRFIYQIVYVNREHLRGLQADAWTKKGKSFKQENNYGVRFTLSPSMSWQIWWRIPVSLLAETHEFSIG